MRDVIDIDPRAPEQVRIIMSAHWARQNKERPEALQLIMRYADNPAFQRIYKMVEDDEESFSDKVRKVLGRTK